MAITKIQSESLNLADTYDFTGTVTGAGESNTPAFHVTQSASQNFANATTTKITFDTEVYDVGGGFDTSNNNFTVPSGEAGKYFFYFQTLGIFCDSNSEVGNAHIFVNNSNTTVVKHNRGTVTTDTTFFNTSILDLSVGDVVDARLYHTQGSTRANDNNSISTYFCGFKISS